MCSDGSHIILIALEDGACADAAVDLPCNAVPVAFRVDTAVNKETFLNGIEITAEFKHLFHEENGTFLELAGLVTEIAVLFELDHFHKAVQTDKGLLCGIAGFDIIDMPRYVPALIGSNSALDISTGELGDYHVENMGYGCFTGAGLDILSVHLRTHAVFVEKITKCNSVGEIHVNTGSRGCSRGNGGQADILLGNTDACREDSIDRMLNHEFGHDLPCFAGGCISVVCTVYLGHSCPCDELLALTGINKGTDHVDIAVDYIVLRILVYAVDALFCEHNSNIGTCNAGNIAVIIDGSSDFIFDHVKGFALSTNLLSGDWNTAHTLRSTFDKPVKVALTGGADDHDMVCTMVRCHAHTADIVFKSAGSDLRGDYGSRLRINISEIMSRRKGNTALKGFGAVMVFKRTHVQILNGFTPYPATAAGTVILEILENFGYVNGFIGCKSVIAHQLLPPLNRFSASCQSPPSIRARPASRISIFLDFARR